MTLYNFNLASKCINLQFDLLVVEPLAMPVTWPLGSYTLLKPTSGCPSGFSEGSVVFTEQRHSGGPPTGLNLAGMYI